MKRFILTLFFIIASLGSVAHYCTYRKEVEIKKEVKSIPKLDRIHTTVFKKYLNLGFDTTESVIFKVENWNAKPTNKNNYGNLRKADGSYYTYSSLDSFKLHWNKVLLRKYSECNSLPPKERLECMFSKGYSPDPKWLENCLTWLNYYNE